MTLVVDLGSHTTKLGLVSNLISDDESLQDESLLSFSIEEQLLLKEPQACEIIPTLVGRQKITSLKQLHKPSDMLFNELKFGIDCITMSDLLSLQPLIPYLGSVPDWNIVDKFMQSSVLNSKKIQKRVAKLDKSLTLLLSENFTAGNRQSREKLTEIAFESLNIANFQFTLPATNILYANGVTTGLVIDMGECSTTITPVVEGFVQSHATKNLFNAGQSILDNLITNLADNGKVRLRTSYEKEIIARDILQQTSKSLKDLNKTVGILPYHLLKQKQTDSDVFYQMPDGSIIESVNQEQFQSIDQTYFESDLIQDGGHLPSIVSKCINKDCDVELRVQLKDNILIAGGTSMLPHMSRLLQQNLNETGLKIQPLKKDRMFHSWLGASLLAELSCDPCKLISKEDYQENGPSKLNLN